MNRTVRRAFQVLKYVAKEDDGLTLTEITELLDCPKSSAFNIIQTLLNLDLLSESKANNKKYPFHICIRIIYRSKLDNPSDTDHQVRNTFFNRDYKCTLNVTFSFFYVTPPLKFIISAPQTAEYIVI